jgi:predicted negative regulator of RcsB-dependent stress response
MNNSQAPNTFPLETESWWSSKILWLAPVGLVLLLIGGLASYTWWDAQRTMAALELQTAFAKAKTPEEKLAVLRPHTHQSYAIPGLCEVANTYYLQGKFLEAQQTYALVDTPKSETEIRAASQLGQAQAYLALNKNESAQSLLEQIVQAKDKSAYQPMAQLTLAKLQLELKQTAPAKKSLEEMLLNYPQSAFVPEARALLLTLP